MFYRKNTKGALPEGQNEHRGSFKLCRSFRHMQQGEKKTNQAFSPQCAIDRVINFIFKFPSAKSPCPGLVLTLSGLTARFSKMYVLKPQEFKNNGFMALLSSTGPMCHGAVESPMLEGTSGDPMLKPCSEQGCQQDQTRFLRPLCCQALKPRVDSGQAFWALVLT